jgi:hypothetical protein
MKLNILLIPIVLTTLTTFSCSEESNTALDTANFTRIFDNNQFDSAFYPIDIKQTADNGYLVLARKKLPGEFAGVYVIKADQYGNFVSENSFADDIVNPTGQLFKKNNDFYFFCMDGSSKSTRMVRIDQSGSTSDIITVDVLYPCASSTTTTGFILLGYDNVNKQTVVATLDEAGSITGSQQFAIGIGGEEQIEETVINSFFQYGKKLPYLVGQIGTGSFYFNGFYNYTFSLVFTDLNSGNPDGIIQGQHDDGGFSAALSLGGANFALSVFNFGENYVLPNQTLNIIASSPGVAVDLGGYILPELSANAQIRILKATISGKEVVIFAGDTKSKTIGLWFYDKSDKKLLGSKYLGFSNPFEVGDLIQTSDEGLAVCGTTYIAGRFPRISIFKLSKEEVMSLSN